jgi:hypothetical protein
MAVNGTGDAVAPGQLARLLGVYRNTLRTRCRELGLAPSRR